MFRRYNFFKKFFKYKHSEDYNAKDTKSSNVNIPLSQNVNFIFCECIAIEVFEVKTQKIQFVYYSDISSAKLSNNNN